MAGYTAYNLYKADREFVGTTSLPYRLFPPLLLQWGRRMFVYEYKSGDYIEADPYEIAPTETVEASDATKLNPSPTA